MTNTFWLQIIASNRVFYKGQCKSLTIPAPDGEKGILPHHEAMVMAVTSGEARFQLEDDSWVDVVVGTGFAQAINNRVTLLVETAEDPDEIDARRAEEARERAQEHLRQKQSIMEHYHTQASLARAMARLKAASHHRAKGI